MFNSILLRMHFQKALVLFAFLSALVISCQPQKPEKGAEMPKKQLKLSKEWKSYWFDGTAEITSYQLSQSRYGSERTGKAVMIFVTEDLRKEEQVKANSRSEKSATVLKRNTTKRFLTGIYPYQIMSSTFNWIRNPESFAKTSLSMQEWCGHSYLQLNNRDEYVLMRHSYFEGEADQQLPLDKIPTEDGLYNDIRLRPETIKTDTLVMLPSLEFLQLEHLPIKGYRAEIQIKEIDSIRQFEVYYPEIDRHLHISTQKDFPYTILGWTEDYKNHLSTARKLQTIKVPYWQLNRVQDSLERKKLQLNEMD